MIIQVIHAQKMTRLWIFLVSYYYLCLVEPLFCTVTKNNQARTLARRNSFLFHTQTAFDEKKFE